MNKTRRALLQLLPLATVSYLLSSLPVYARKYKQSAIPILMFHKVNDNPQFPEDISSKDLENLFHYVFKLGYRPVNISDIIQNKVDDVVSKGFMPIGISADDAHPSILFSKQSLNKFSADAGAGQKFTLQNATSFMDIFVNVAKSYDIKVRASLFLGEIADDRYSKLANGYFGNQDLKNIIDKLSILSGLEFGYHTRKHTMMRDMGASETRALLKDQMEYFERLKIYNKVKRILAYPYGVAPSSSGIRALKDLGFQGAVLALPGVNEASYTSIDQCSYDGKLRIDPFFIPRVCIGSKTYAPKGSRSSYYSIDPREDFKKDVEKVIKPYTC